MDVQLAADKLRHSIAAPGAALTVWPWHYDDGRVVMMVVLDGWVDAARIPTSFEGFEVEVQKDIKPTVHATI